MAAIPYNQEPKYLGVFPKSCGPTYAPDSDRGPKSAYKHPVWDTRMVQFKYPWGMPYSTLVAR